VWAIVLLAVLGALVLFGGVFVVLGIYGVRKYIANAKTAEAYNSLGQIAKDATAQYEKETIDLGAVTHRICPSASRSVPASLSMVSGKKYQSAPGDWTVDAPMHAGFACLEYSMDMPQYYLYSYEASPSAFTATAQGDLDGDGSPSTFRVRGAVSGGTLQVAPNIEAQDPHE